MVICPERGADLHMAQLMPLPRTISCFSKIQIGFTFLVPAHLGSARKRDVKRACVCNALTEGEHTRTKTMVASKVGGLAAFTKKRETCIGCKTPLDKQGN